MKKLYSLAVTLLLFVSGMVAQNSQADIFAEAFGSEKKALVESLMDLSGSEETSFFEIYDEYEVLRKELGQKRIALIKKAADNQEKLDPVIAEQVIKDMVKLNTEYDKLIVKYYKKLNKAMDYKIAGKFFNIEVYFQSVIRSILLEQFAYLNNLDD